MWMVSIVSGLVIGGPNIPRLDSVAVTGKGTELTPSTVRPDKEWKPHGIFYWVYGDDATSPPDEGYIFYSRPSIVSQLAFTGKMLAMAPQGSENQTTMNQTRTIRRKV
ncbi:hypothetical protein C8J57DRAFT_1245794 [Mycena rebaudengoi]|nr:hypothetical protein C8J57DRAFT_1245794 [Mycena rebaudengoi]